MNRDVWKKRRSRRNFCIALYTAIYINCLLDGTKYIIFRPSFNKNFDVIRDFSFFSFPGKREHYLSRAFRVVYSELISSAKWFNLIYPRCRSRGRAKSDPTVYPVHYVPERREQIQSDFRGRPEQAPPPPCSRHIIRIILVVVWPRQEDSFQLNFTSSSPPPPSFRA